MFIERGKLRELIKKRTDDGISVDTIAKELDISNEIVYTWLTVEHSDKGIRCERKQQIEELIIDKFFKDCKKERAKYLLGNEKKENTIFDNMLNRQLNVDKMHSVKDVSIKNILKKLEKVTYCKEVYIFSREIKGLISLKDLYKLDILELQEAIVYFKNDYAYFQHEENGYKRECYVLF